MDCSLVIMESSLLLRFCYSVGWQPCHYGSQSVVEIFVTLMDGSLIIMEVSLLSKIFVTPINGSLVIMEGSLSLIFLLLQRIVAFSLWKVVCCSYFCYFNVWQPCHFGRQPVVENFLFHCMVALSLWKVVCVRDICYSNGW